MSTQLWAIGLVLIAGMIGGFGPIYLKKGSALINKKKLSTIYKNRQLYLGIFLYGISTIMFVPALKGGELSVLYPLLGLGYAWVCIYSIFLLKEKMTMIKWILYVY